MNQITDTKNKDCIINYSSGNYTIGQKRLRESLKNLNFHGDILLLKDDDFPFLPKQEACPWAFKALAFQVAISKGYENILWLDSNCIVIRNPKSIFKKINKNGYYFASQSSHKMGEWCSDLALDNFGISREISFTIPEVNAAYIGLNSKNKISLALLNEWTHFALDGETFLGVKPPLQLKDSFSNKNNCLSNDKRVFGHRHDQTTLSFLVWKYKLLSNVKEFKNIQWVSENGKNKYSRAIPFSVEIVQNRDIKSSEYLESYNKWGNNTGIKKIIFFIYSFISTINLFFSNFNHKD